jgi:hypothetical protein
VNTLTTSPLRADPAVASDADGNFVVTWQSFVNDGITLYELKGQRFASTGAPLGGEYRVNTHTTNNQIYPAVASDPTGAHVVTWTSCWTQEGSGCGVFGQRYGGIAAPGPQGLSELE